MRILIYLWFCQKILIEHLKKISWATIVKLDLFTNLLVFRRKDLCEAKHDVACLKFCSKLDDFGGGKSYLAI